MEEQKSNEIISIPLICKENSDQRMFKIIKLLIILIILSNLAWGGVFCAYLFAPTQVTESSTTQDTEGNGINNYIGNDGDINGETNN